MRNRSRSSLLLVVLCWAVGCGPKSSGNGDIDLDINGAGGGSNHPPPAGASGGGTGTSGADAGPASLHPEFDWKADGGDVCYPYLPETNRELLNACEDGCVPFMTALPLLRGDGSLPPLPPP